MSSQRYRITVTPIANDGLPRSGCCTIEFERRSNQDWMRQLETVQNQRQFTGDDSAALVVGLQLLKDLSQARSGDQIDLLQLRQDVLRLLDRLGPRPQ